MRIRRVDVPESYFDRQELTAYERDYLIRKAQESAHALVTAARRRDGPILWHEAGAFKGVQVFRGEARTPIASDTGRDDINYVCGATAIHATLEEVAEYFDVSSTPKLKALAASENDILDGVVLYNLVAPTHDNQHMHQVTVKWTVMNVSSPLVRHRDFLTLECQDEFTDSTGRRGWVRSFHSVHLPCCPDLQRDLGYVRGSVYHSGYVFVESERPGWLDVIYSLQLNYKGSVFLPHSVYLKMMKNRIGTLATLGRTLLGRRLGKNRFLEKRELVRKSQRTVCDVCFKKFGFMKRKTRCRMCGQVVCHPCSQVWDVSDPYRGLDKVRVCYKCCMNTKLSEPTLEHRSGLSDPSTTSPSTARTPANQPFPSPFSSQRQTWRRRSRGATVLRPFLPAQYVTPPSHNVPIQIAESDGEGEDLHGGVAWGVSFHLPLSPRKEAETWKHQRAASRAYECDGIDEESEIQDSQTVKQRRTKREPERSYVSERTTLSSSAVSSHRQSLLQSLTADSLAAHTRRVKARPTFQENSISQTPYSRRHSPPSPTIHENQCTPELVREFYGQGYSYLPLRAVRSESTASVGPINPTEIKETKKRTFSRLKWTPPTPPKENRSTKHSCCVIIDSGSDSDSDASVYSSLSVALDDLISPVDLLSDFPTCSL